MKPGPSQAGPILGRQDPVEQRQQGGLRMPPQPLQTAPAPKATSSPLTGVMVVGAIVAVLAIGAVWALSSATPAAAPGSAAAPQVTPTIQQAGPQTAQVPIIGQREVSSDAMWGIVMLQTHYVRTTNEQVISGYGSSLDTAATTETVSGVKVVALQTPASTWITTMGGAVGDVILSYDGVPVTSGDVVNQVHTRHKAKDVVTVTVDRGGQMLVLRGQIGSVTVQGALP